MSPSYAVCLALGMEALTRNNQKLRDLGLTTAQLYAFMEQHAENIASVSRKNWKSGLRHCLSGHRAFYQPEAHRTWRMKEKYLPKSALVALKRLRRIMSSHPDFDIDAAIDLVLADNTEPTATELEIESPLSNEHEPDADNRSDGGTSSSSRSFKSKSSAEDSSNASTVEDKPHGNSSNALMPDTPMAGFGTISTNPLQQQMFALQEQQRQLVMQQQQLKLLMMQHSTFSSRIPPTATTTGVPSLPRPTNITNPTTMANFAPPSMPNLAGMANLTEMTNMAALNTSTGMSNLSSLPNSMLLSMGNQPPFPAMMAPNSMMAAQAWPRWQGQMP
eukprot:TRINITY_DN12862_c0_g1_i1.p1 TRINITY_DN12862_c0_g1~~TRINITY_DN12862_c0_g1_i1.p1  ORF type:complete len:332 (+),score=62.64 TRINITY_DN12862_c0_g1_i1:283-1278(+)